MITMIAEIAADRFVSVVADGVVPTDPDFRFDEEYFPDPRAMVAELAELGLADRRQPGRVHRRGVGP